jgi:hypothetical protein
MIRPGSPIAHRELDGLDAMIAARRRTTCLPAKARERQ